MAKRRRARRSKEQKRTNWLVIGGIGLVGVIIVFGLLYLALREPETVSLADFCLNNPENCVVEGAADAPVTVVEISDFGCTHCRTFHQQTAPLIDEQYVANGDVRWIYLPYALRPETLPPANAALCAEEQGQYAAFTSAMFGLPALEDAQTRDGIFTAAEQVGLDIEPFTTCVEEGRYNSVISENQQLARAAQVSGTPTFFVNDQIVRGAVPFEEFQRQFARYLES